MERIGNPPIYTQYLTSLMILKRQEEFPHLEPVDMHVVKEGDSFTVGGLTVKTFPVTHSIPDAMGTSVITKHGNIVITGDIKLKHENGKVLVEEQEEWEKVGKDNNLALICDSTNADQSGFSAPEGVVFHSLEEIITNAQGRLIIGTFASQFDRLISIIKVCERLGKKVVMEGRSIKTNIDIALAAKLLTVDPKTFIDGSAMGDYPSDRLVILSTGAQGEEHAALMRMATDKHKYITLTERDTIVLSSSVIPGNEVAVQKLKDNIYRKNVRVINYRSAAVHSSGHGNAGELVWIHQAVKPKYLIPVHGHHYHLKSHMYLAIENGFPRDHIFVPDNGTIIDIKNGEEVTIQKDKAPNDVVLVDGFTVGARQEVVLRDRQSLSEDGMFVIIATINTKTGKLRKSPDIISRGFIYLRESQQLLSEARVLIKKTVEKHTERMHPLDLDIVKDELSDTVSSFLMQRTQKSPMVIPVLIGI
jgi:ribonuclease J